MKFRLPPGSAAFTLVLCGLMLASSGCRKRSNESGPGTPAPVVLAPELEMNRLGQFPGAIYRSQAKSPIRWQPWTSETMKMAADANRLVFAVIAMPQQPGFQKVLAALAADPQLVVAIHEEYVPVLIDGDASREIGLLTADLTAEIKRPLQLPLFLWMTPEGNPVAWIPVSGGSAENIAEVFNQSHSMVSRTWAEDSGYVKKNSALDNENRRTRISRRKNQNVMSEEPAADVVRSLRQLASFYDPLSRSFDEAGGLFPSGSIDLLATAAVHPGLPEDVRARCLETTRELLVDLLPSAMFDPLEGGVFTSRRANSWSFPSFTRDCGSQARAAVALISAYRATGDKRARERAIGLIEFAEKEFMTPDGLFAVGMAEETDPADWLWSVEEIEKELPAEDAAWWIKATGMKGLGNLPSEVDPRREFFRSNSLAISRPLSEIAAELGETPEEFAVRYERTRKQLLKVRSTRLGPFTRDRDPHAGVTYRMVSAYAAAFGVTGDESYREKAVALLEKARDAFGSGPGLRLFSTDSPPSIGDGRAFLYGLAMQAALDVSSITSDDNWLVWCEDLATTAAEMFTGSDFLKETPDAAKIIDLPVTDLVMLFDDSTAGLISFAECRLAARERPLVESFSELATPLPVYAADRPVLHTDLLQAAIAREYPVTVIAGTDLPADLKLAIERLPMRMIQRSEAKSGDDVPAGSAKVVLGDGEGRMISSAADLQDVLLPSTRK